ncbi:MAG TPA: hypothetical protein VH989_01720 [Actinomycetota bacterium]|jgi:hypothetical protein
MRMIRGSLAAVRIAAGVLVLSASIALAADGLPRLGSTGGEGLATASSAVSVKISGHVSGMVPGRVATIKATVRNPGSVSVVVKQVSASVGDAGPGCDAGNLVVTHSKKAVHIGPGRRVKVKLRATMAASAPDACQGLTFPLSFHAKVRPA